MTKNQKENNIEKLCLLGADLFQTMDNANKSLNEVDSVFKTYSHIENKTNAEELEHVHKTVTSFYTVLQYLYDQVKKSSRDPQLKEDMRELLAKMDTFLLEVKSRHDTMINKGDNNRSFYSRIQEPWNQTKSEKLKVFNVSQNIISTLNQLDENELNQVSSNADLLFLSNLAMQLQNDKNSQELYNKINKVNKDSKEAEIEK